MLLEIPTVSYPSNFSIYGTSKLPEGNKINYGCKCRWIEVIDVTNHIANTFLTPSKKLITNHIWKVHEQQHHMESTGLAVLTMQLTRHLPTDYCVQQLMANSPLGPGWNPST